VELVAVFDRDGVPAAETWRQLGQALERIGLSRPSYHHVRRLVRIERRRRELRAEARELVADAAGRFAAGRVPNVVWTLERIRELQLAEELVVQQHKPFDAGEDAAE
jgi:hypothetical protein